MTSKATIKKLVRVEKLLCDINKLLTEVEEANGLENFESSARERRGWTFNMSCDRWNYTAEDALRILEEMKKERAERDEVEESVGRIMAGVD